MGRCSTGQHRASSAGLYQGTAVRNGSAIWHGGNQISTSYIAPWHSHCWRLECDAGCHFRAKPGCVLCEKCEPVAHAGLVGREVEHALQVKGVDRALVYVAVLPDLSVSTQAIKSRLP